MPSNRFKALVWWSQMLVNVISRWDLNFLQMVNITIKHVRCFIAPSFPEQPYLFMVTSNDQLSFFDLILKKLDDKCVNYR